MVCKRWHNGKLHGEALKRAGKEPDEISKVINEDFDRLVDLQEPEGEGGKEECR